MRGLITADLRVTPAAAGWVLTVHALALGAGTALFGRLVDAWGARRTLAFGSAILALGTLTCLLSPNLGWLIAGRFLLAAGSGAMTTTAITLAGSSPAEHRARLLGIFGAVLAVFSAGATLAAGLITAGLSWRVTVVLPALSLLAVPLTVRPAAASRGSGRPVDLPGAVLLTAAAAALLILIQAPVLRLAWPRGVVGAALSRMSGAVSGGPRLPAAIITVSALALGWIGLSGGGIAAPLLAAATGVAAFTVTQVVTTAQLSAHVPVERRGAAIGLRNLAFFVGGAVGSATVGTLSHALPLPTALALVGLLPLAAAGLSLALR
ncbi:MFS transporter [Nonomuraea sediminis]|uniref:MFS transporter n=1 Tax=Nonomuraea sediminis TaxID=2835864 RepID=UPI001BDC8E44|nr:MFS transporter [Nonomuraea sediminis]